MNQYFVARMISMMLKLILVLFPLIRKRLKNVAINKCRNIFSFRQGSLFKETSTWKCTRELPIYLTTKLSRMQKVEIKTFQFPPWYLFSSRSFFILLILHSKSCSSRDINMAVSSVPAPSPAVNTRPLKLPDNFSPLKQFGRGERR